MRHVAASLLNRNGNYHCGKLVTKIVTKLVTKIVTKWGPNMLACPIVLHWLLPLGYLCCVHVYAHGSTLVFLYFLMLSQVFLRLRTPL